MFNPRNYKLAGESVVPSFTGRQRFATAVSFLMLGIFLAAMLLSGRIARAQTIGTGSIQGTVLDAEGAAVPGATATAVNPATGYTVTQHVSTAGFYVLASLPPAHYTVTVSATGFATLVQQNVIVNALAVVGLNRTLKVGTANQRVVVSGLPPQLNTTNGSLEVTIPNSTYSQLPLAMNGGPKDPLGFVTLLPGATTGAILSYNFNGGPGSSSTLYIDGMPVTTPELQGDIRNIVAATSTEVVDQFQVISSGVPAYYAGQGITNLILKSGTNRFHGDIYENIRNTLFDAAGYFSSKTPVEQQNEFGASLGGPILKNRMFFFFNYDGYHIKQGANPAFYSLPTAAERTGDFSALPVPVYDPATTVCSSSGICTRQPFPGNIIPANRISNISQSLQSYLPGTINPSLQNNYLGVLTSGAKQNMLLGKIDLTVNKSNHLYIMLQHGLQTPTALGPNGGPQLPLPYTSSRTATLGVNVIQIGDTGVITQNLVNTFGYQFNRYVTPFTNPTAGGDYSQKAGLTGLPPGPASSYFPPISFGGPNAPTGWSLFGFTAAFGQYVNTNIYQDNLQWLHGRHSITVGGQILFQSENEPFPSALTGINFNNTETAGFDSAGGLLANTGNSYASYLLGDVDSAGLIDNYVEEAGGRWRNYALYLQDDIKVTPKLTVNAGLRYEIPKPYVEVKDQNSWLNPNLPNPAVSNFPGALQFAGNGIDSCHCRTLVKTHYLTLDPRVGFAYGLTSKTVIRGSYTINHFNVGALGGNSDSQGTGLLGYNASPSFSTPNSGITPAFNWGTGIPAYQKPPFFSSILNTGYNTTAGATGGGVTYNRPNTGGLPAYTENWNLTVEQQLTPATVLSLSYAASASHHIPVNGGLGIYSDQLNPKYLTLGNLLLQPETSATLAQAQAIVPGIKLPYPNFSGSIGQMLRPFPQYAGVSDPYADPGNASYNSLQAYLQHVMSHGLYLLASYTWSKEIDDTGGNVINFVSSAPRSAYDLAAERSVGALDMANNISLTYVYALPFGRGHLLGAQNRLINVLVGGWQLSGLQQYTSGTPLGPIGAACNVPYTGGCYADYNPTFTGPVRINGSYGSGNPRGANPTSYINPNAYQNPASFTFGDTPRTAPSGLRNPWSLNESISLSKNFTLPKAMTLKFQADAFNLFNRTVFGGINTNITSSSFGTVGGQANAPRNLQFEAYITF